MLSIEARHFASGFAIDSALFQIGAFIARDFALGHADLGFELPIFPIELQHYQSPSANLRLTV